MEGGGDGALACIECGYDVRGLSEPGHCPECGTDLARSSAGLLLRNADAAWLRGVVRGVAWMRFGAWVGRVVVLVSLLLYVVVLSVLVLVEQWDTRWLDFILIGWSWIGSVLFVAFLASMLSGLGMLARLNAAGQTPAGSWGEALRWLVVASSGMYAMWFLEVVFIRRGPSLPVWLGLSLAIAPIVVGCALIVTSRHVVWRFDQRCAGHAPRKHGARARWIPGIALGVIAALPLLRQPFPSGWGLMVMGAGLLAGSGAVKDLLPRMRVELEMSLRARNGGAGVGEKPDT